MSELSYRSESRPCGPTFCPELPRLVSVSGVALRGRVFGLPAEEFAEAGADHGYAGTGFSAAHTARRAASHPAPAGPPRRSANVRLAPTKCVRRNSELLRQAADV